MTNSFSSIRYIRTTCPNYSIVMNSGSDKCTNRTLSVLALSNRSVLSWYLNVTVDKGQVLSIKTPYVVSTRDGAFRITSWQYSTTQPNLIRDLRHNFREACVANRQVTFCYSIELNSYFNTKQQQEQAYSHFYLEIILDIN